VDWPERVAPERLAVRFTRFTYDTVLAAPAAP
jgi:hypothetical protein